MVGNEAFSNDKVKRNKEADSKLEKHTQILGESSKAATYKVTLNGKGRSTDKNFHGHRMAKLARAETCLQ